MKPGPKPMTRGVCNAPGCARIADHPIAGLCHMHYARMRRRGSLDATRRTPGTGTITKYGYLTDGQSKRFAHVLIAEAAIGRRLPIGAEVHHANGNRLDNRPTNLVICPSRAYHKLLHTRMDALAACGNPNFRKCPFCKEYDATENLRHNKSSRYYYHASCKTNYRREKQCRTKP